MKIVLAPDSFKGTMSSMEVIEHLAAAAKKHFNQVEIIKVPIADGGEGTVDALVSALNGEYRHVEACGPLGSPVRAKYGIVNGDTAVIEMAQASGIMLLEPGQLNPLYTTTYGTGQLIKAALDDGIRKIIIGIGGSATNDGGIGAAQALGVRFLDADNNEVGFGGKELSRINHIFISGLDERIQSTQITVICDVSNPLTGETGATRTFGPQKGATPEMLEELEQGMVHYSQVVRDKLGIAVNSIPGSGAAGGMGAALIGFLGAELCSGINVVLDLVGFDGILDGADLVVTGEGRIDGQTVFGKVPVGIAGRCKSKGVRVIAVAGCLGQDSEKVYDFGIDGIMQTVQKDMSLEEALKRAGEDLSAAAERMFRLIKVGMELKV